MSIDLSSLDSQWQETKSDVRVKPPVGAFTAVIKHGKVFESKSGRPCMVLNMDADGVVIDKLYVLDSPHQMKFLKDDLARFGIVLPQLSKIEDVIPSLIGRRVKGAVVEKGEYLNVYINDVLAESPDAVPF